MKFKFTWAHGIIVALGSFMIFIVTLLLTAGHAGDVVSEDYYEEDLSYQKVIDAKKNYNELKVKPEIVYQANGILIIFKDSLNLPKDGGQVYLERSNNTSQDVTQQLRLNNKNEHLISSAYLNEGVYALTLNWDNNRKSYQYSEIIEWNGQSQ